MIRDAVAWVVEQTALAAKPWCVLGKGPSADFACRVDWRDYHVLSLNHACTLPGVRPLLAHFVDLEAFWDCAEVFHRAGPVPVFCCLPWHPHLACRPSPGTLEDWALSERADVLHDLACAGRLVSYNADNNRLARHPRLPAVHLRYFSAVAAFSLLGQAGLKEVYSLGVDGGRGYAQAFDPKDRLRNGRASFDAQTPEVEKLCRRHGLTHTRLGDGLAPPA